jgi:tetratricopeptide (TPR) repeat protein
LLVQQVSLPASNLVRAGNFFQNSSRDLLARSPELRNNGSIAALQAASMKTLPITLAGVLVCTLSVSLRAQTPDEAIAFEQQGKLAEAAEAWRAVTARNPGDAAAFAALGSVLSKEQKYSDADAAYRKALALDSKLPGIELNLGLAEFKQGHFTAAAVALRSALAQDPTSAQASILLGMSYYGAKKFDLAVEYLGPAAKANPENAELQELLAQSCLWAGKFSCAQEEFHKIVEQNPDSAQSHILTGEALDGLGRTEEAIAEFEAAAKIAPREPNLHFGLGYLYWKKQQYDRAKQEFQTELSVDPNNAQALAYLGDIAWKNDDAAAALTFLNQSRKLSNDLRIVQLDLGEIYLRQKNYSEARVALRRAVQLDPEQPDAHYQLSRLYQTLGEKTSAEKELQKVQELHNKADENLVRKMANSPPALDPPH